MSEMTRVVFTRKVVQMLQEMLSAGEVPIIDYVKRSKEGQKALFEKGLSSCDGETRYSMHQFGKAVDIYFVQNGRLVAPTKGWEFWHKRWEELGGKKTIVWDKGHFEV